MAKAKPKPTEKSAAPTAQSQAARETIRSSSKSKAADKSSSPAPKSHAIRETVESIVIAFVLAFLFRTFEAEAFVIPTGSMAPTLMGRHKDVDCPKCGYRYQVSASEEESEDPRRAPQDCIAGMCPMCHYVLPMRPDLPEGVQERQLAETRWRKDHGKSDDYVPTADQLAEYIHPKRSYNGDRILVNKYIYAFSDPQRWDVIVFKFPGDAKVNYIKRLVGLPGEKLWIYQGDIFLGNKDSSKETDYEIARKPPSRLLAMRQLVHDTDYDPAELDAAGWPLRWHSPADSGANAWKVEKTIDSKNVRQLYSVDTTGGGESWLRYENTPPPYKVWQKIADAKKRGETQPLSSDGRDEARRLITDANPYDGRLLRPRAASTLEIEPKHQGIHWVGDLMVEADLEVESAKGELLLDLVEGGRHFTCRIDLASGEAKLSAENVPEFAPKSKESLSFAGKHHVAFANFDDQLLLWVDGDVVEFDAPTAYDANRVFGNRERIRPETSKNDLGDLAPAGIAARDAKLSVNRLKVWRDIYYIADDWRRNPGPHEPVTDFPHSHFDTRLYDLASRSTAWDRYGERSKGSVFELNDEQLFVMGDNSAESSDARLWAGNSDRGRPGGPYLERRLLIGKALCVYWPHSWDRFPGTAIPFPLFPNFADMRLVR